MSETDAGRRREQRWRVVGWLVLVACVVVVVWQGAVVGGELWRERWVQDDAYISFRYAKHLVEGHGLVYNIGDHVEGYTNFLWTVIAALVMATGVEDPTPAMQVVGMAAWLVALVTLLLLAAVLAREDGYLAAPLVVLPLLAHYSFGLWFVSAMETPLVSVLTVGMVVLMSLDAERWPWLPTAASSAGVLLVMTRPDGVVAVAAVALVAVVVHRRQLVVQRRWKPFVLGPVLPWLVVYLPYTAWRVAYYGSVFPNTYYAKAAYLTYYERGWAYLSAYLEIYRLWPFLLVLGLGLVVARPGTARRFLWFATAATAGAFFYVVRLGGDFMEWRFVTPVSGVLYPAIGVAGGAIVHAVAVWLGRRAARCWSVAAATVAVAAVAVVLTVSTAAATGEARSRTVPGQETITLLARYCDPEQYDWRAVGRAFDRVLPDEVTIATTSAGAIPFFCDRRCLDLHGLTDPVIARELVDPERRGRMGHEHWLTDYNVMRERGVDIYLPWADIWHFPRALGTPPEDGRQLVSVRFKERRWADFLVLEPSSVALDELAEIENVRVFDPSRAVGREQIIRMNDVGWRVVDRLDLEDPSSEEEHDFVEEFLPQAPYGHNYHSKTLPYVENSPMVVEDDGRRIYHAARWRIAGVQADRPLRMVVRHDGSGQPSRYRLLVNGHELETELRFPWTSPQWSEVAITVPATALVQGENRFELIRVRTNPGDAELYHLWFLQPHEPTVSTPP